MIQRNCDTIRVSGVKEIVKECTLHARRVLSDGVRLCWSYQVPWALRRKAVEKHG
jgi:hypothetical protein